jgi:hypothetical protein
MALSKVPGGGGEPGRTRYRAVRKVGRADRRRRERTGESDMLVVLSRIPGLGSKLAVIAFHRGMSRHMLVLKLLQDFAGKAYPQVPDGIREAMGGPE